MKPSFPCKENENLAKPMSASRILTAVYCRVSTSNPHQLNSLENQITYYQEMLKDHPRYQLAEIYCDRGISGYKEKRPGFQQLLEDARKGCFRQIITKSVTRFARNTITILQITRELAELGIDVYFELQEIHTMSLEGELLLTLFAAFGQAESEGARRHTQMAIQQKYENGQPIRQLHRCLGYEKDSLGNLFPGKGASLVQEIFQMAAMGYRISEIARYLNEEGVKTQNEKQFYRSTVSRILHNNAYKGEYTAQRYYVNHDRKLVRNKGEKPMYHIEKDHVALISETLWNEAQEKLNARRKPAEQGGLEGSTLEKEKKRKSVYCALCGYPLTFCCRRGEAFWECSGKKRFTTSFCTGVSVPGKMMEEISETISEQSVYVGEVINRGKVTSYKFISEEQWKKSNQKKLPSIQKPELNEENYPYKDRIFCKYCGGRQYIKPPWKRCLQRNPDTG